jgi:hypothetical protein
MTWHKPGSRYDLGASGGMLTQGFRAPEWGAAAVDAGCPDAGGRVSNISPGPF